MIGWYHSGPKLRASDLEINDLFKQYIPRPVMVIVDVRPEAVGIPTDAYFAVEEIKDVRPYFFAVLSRLNDWIGRNGDTQNILTCPVSD